MRGRAGLLRLPDRFASLNYPIAKLVRVNDARETHVVRLPRAVPGSFKLKRREVTLLENRSLDEGHVLDVLEWDCLLDLKQNSLAESQCAAIKAASEPVKVVPRLPGPNAAQPDDRERYTDDRKDHGQPDSHHQVGPLERVKCGDDGAGGRGGRSLDSSLSRQSSNPLSDTPSVPPARPRACLVRFFPGSPRTIKQTSATCSGSQIIYS